MLHVTLSQRRVLGRYELMRWKFFIVMIEKISFFFMNLSLLLCSLLKLFLDLKVPISLSRFLIYVFALVTIRRRSMMALTI